ncbi:hypothetical protein Patl1_29508 [Pistacia atlantica]|uniref:Uncharacterized protein n=1 Tax=Pistacia atlantica TaxID=434234 RepID=A0ACC1AF28_9ROSI|nr:hypothetical protein Patl1_29508 [Pistacia atlantica]
MAQDAGMFMVPQTIGSVLCCECGVPMLLATSKNLNKSPIRIEGAVDVKRLKNLNGARLTHAEFIRTEPHSKRIKVKLTVQEEVLNGAILEQSYVFEYHQQDQMCESLVQGFRPTLINGLQLYS